MRCLPTISFIGHHALFIVHAHPCVLLKNMRLFGSHCIGLHIWVTATLTQLDSCVMNQGLVTNPSLTYPLCLCSKDAAVTERNVYKVVSPQGSSKGIWEVTSPTECPILMLFQSNLITTIIQKGLMSCLLWKIPPSSPLIIFKSHC